MVYINEWLPNPTGKDLEGEWVEIFNGEPNAVNVSGWKLETKGGKRIVLSGEVNGQGYLVLKKPELKISLHNQDGELSLYDAAGKLVDSRVFFGSAAEGKSFSRTDDGNYLFSEPTPGAENKFLEQTAVIGDVYPAGRQLNNSFGGLEFFILVLGVATVLTGLIIYIVKNNEDLSKLFFGRDKKDWE